MRARRPRRDAAADADHVSVVIAVVAGIVGAITGVGGILVIPALSPGMGIGVVVSWLHDQVLSV